MGRWHADILEKVLNTAIFCRYVCVRSLDQSCIGQPTTAFHLIVSARNDPLFRSTSRSGRFSFAAKSFFACFMDKGEDHPLGLIMDREPFSPLPKISLKTQGNRRRLRMADQALSLTEASILLSARSMND